MPGLYDNFELLQATEREGVDYRIHARRGPSGVALMALHGGDIEPGTSEVAAAVASHQHSLYIFEGMKSRGNRQLHLPSTLFDEPRGVRMARESEMVVTVHGCAEKEAMVLLGGLNALAVCRVRSALTSAGFPVDSRDGLQGIHPRNLCNLGRGGGGVQVELSSGLRRAMFLNLTRSGRRRTTNIFDLLVATLTFTLENLGDIPDNSL